MMMMVMKFISYDSCHATKILMILVLIIIMNSGDIQQMWLVIITVGAQASQDPD